MATRPSTPAQPNVAQSATDKAKAEAEAAAKLAEKKAKFIELANKRVSKALDAIANVGNLAARKGSFDANQVAAIEKHMNAELDTCLKRFQTALSGGNVAKGTRFSL